MGKRLVISQHLRRHWSTVASLLQQTTDQFSVLVTVVVLTAILPTIVAQRWFAPPEANDR